MKIKVIRTTGRNSSLTVSDQVFDNINDQLLAQAVRVYLSNKRQGTSKTQTRSDVSVTTRKWYAQKGTGNARHGAQDATLFVGGAVAHGPTGMENWKKSLSQQQKKQALRAALSAQVENILINDEILELSGKTKEAFQLLDDIINDFNEAFELTENIILIVLTEKNEKFNRAVNNIKNIRVLLANQLNALVVAKADLIILTSEALEALQQNE